MQVEVEDAYCHRENYFDPEQRHENEKILIVPLTYASSEPHTMMIISYNAIVANVAVRCPGRPKNLTSFTKFKFE